MAHALAELATVTEVNLGEDEDARSRSCWIWFKTESGYPDMFGALFPQGIEQERDFVRALCAVFEVEHVEEIEGRSCTVRRCFARSNAPIEALEGPGDSLVLHRWARKFAETLDPLQRAQNTAQNQIRRLRFQLEKACKEAEEIPDLYHPIPE